MQARTTIQHVVSTTNNTRDTHNPLYNILDEIFPKFSPEIEHILDKRPIKKMASHIAYLIGLTQDANAIINLFDNTSYKLCKRHLRIDATYQKHNPYVSPAHYTEVYLSTELNSQIVMHAYFNALGNYTHAEMKQTDLSSNNVLALVVSQENLHDILNNLTTASILLRSLLKHKHDLYQAELTNSYAFEAELDCLSRRINTNTGFTNYKNKCIMFQTCIQKINALNELAFDSRGTAVGNLLNIFSANRANIQPTHCTDAMPVDIEPSKNLPTMQKTKAAQRTSKTHTTNNPQPDYTLICSKLGEEASKNTNLVNSILSSNNISDNCQKLYALIANMQLTLLEFFDLPTKSRNKETIKCLEFTITQATSFIKGSLTKAISTSDIATLQDIFSISQHYLDFNFCNTFVDNLATASSERDADIDNLFAVCDFLHANSAVFRNAMLLFMNSYIQSANKDVCCSRLLILYTNNNLRLFQKLITYGADCNVGMLKTTNNKCFPLISTILHLQQRPHSPLPYIDALLSNNTLLLSGKDFSQKFALIYMSKKDTPLPGMHNGHTNEDMSLVIDHVYELQPLEIAIQSSLDTNSEIVARLIPHSSLKTLALSAASISDNQYVRTANFPSFKSKGVLVCATTEEKSSLYEQHFCKNNADKLTFLLSVHVPATDSFRAAATIICQALYNKAQLPHQDAPINLSVQQILANHNTCYAHRKLSYKKIQLKACLFLLAHKSPLNLQDSLLITDLFSKLVALIQQQNVPDLLRATMGQANYFIKCSKFTNELSQAKPQATTVITTQYKEIVNTNKTLLLLKVLQATRENNYATLFTHLQDPIFDLINIDDRSMSGHANKTALHDACINNSYPCAKLLILCGADPYLLNSTGINCLNLLTDDNIKLALTELYQNYAEIVEATPALATVIKRATLNTNQVSLDEHLPCINGIEIKHSIHNVLSNNTALYNPQRLI